MASTMDSRSDEVIEGPSTYQHILEIECERAKERIDQQHETLKEFSREGMTMFRLILLFLAAPIALLGALDPQTLIEVNNIVTSGEPAISGDRVIVELRHSFFAGGVFLIMGLAMNLLAAGYEARGTHNHSNPDDVEKLLSNNSLLENYWSNRLSSYQQRLRHNDRIIWSIESYLLLGKVFLLVSLVFITTLISVIMRGAPVPFIVWVFFFLAFLIPMIMFFKVSPSAYIAADSIFTYRPVYEVDFDSQLTTTDSEDNQTVLDYDEEQESKEDESDINGDKGR